MKFTVVITLSLFAATVFGQEQIVAPKSGPYLQLVVGGSVRCQVVPDQNLRLEIFEELVRVAETNGEMRGLHMVATTPEIQILAGVAPDLSYTLFKDGADIVQKNGTAGRILIRETRRRCAGDWPHN